jgi:copper ion binding protein
MKPLSIAILLIAFVGCSSRNQDPRLKTEVATVKLPSMVCKKCANTIEKAVYQVEGVKDVSIDVDKKQAQITFVSFQTNIQTIERAINDAGYDANDTKRDTSAYQALEKCCKIDG